VRREALKDGFLQQHVLEATLPDQEEVTVDYEEMEITLV
jgi:hypothetical protein